MLCSCLSSLNCLTLLVFTSLGVGLYLHWSPSMCLAHSSAVSLFDVSNDLVVSFDRWLDGRALWNEMIIRNPPWRLWCRQQDSYTFHGSPQWGDQEVQDVWCPWTPGLLSVVEASPLTSMVCCCLLCQECIYEGMMRDYHRCGCRFAYVVLW